MSIKELWGDYFIVSHCHIGPKHRKVLLIFRSGYGIRTQVSLKKVYEEYIKSMYENRI